MHIVIILQYQNLTIIVVRIFCAETISSSNVQIVLKFYKFSLPFFLDSPEADQILPGCKCNSTTTEIRRNTEKLNICVSDVELQLLLVLLWNVILFWVFFLSDTLSAFGG